MYKREFDALVSSKKLPNYMLLYGACEYQIQIAEDEILNFWGKEGVLKFYFDEYDFKSARAYLSQSSLFGDQNTLILKVEKSPPSKEIEALIELCNKNDINNLLLVFFGDDAKAKTLIKPFGKNFVRFFKPNLNEALTFLHVEAKKINLNISNFALQHLYTTHNENLSFSVNELEKLALLNKEISVKDIDNLVCGMGEVSIEDFIVKLLDKKDIVQMYKSINENGSVDEIRLINSLQSYLAGLFAFHSYIKLNGNFDALKILGYPLPPQLAKQRADQSIRLKLDTYSKLFTILVNTEYELKTNSHIDKNSLLIATFLELQRALN
ncbi:MAG: DNA polymerase III subunit delta [Campylobacteraceae bacterium]